MTYFHSMKPRYQYFIPASSAYVKARTQQNRTAAELAEAVEAWRENNNTSLKNGKTHHLPRNEKHLLAFTSQEEGAEIRTYPLFQEVAIILLEKMNYAFKIPTEADYKNAVNERTNRPTPPMQCNPGVSCKP